MWFPNAMYILYVSKFCSYGNKAEHIPVLPIEDGTNSSWIWRFDAQVGILESEVWFVLPCSAYGKYDVFRKLFLNLVGM